MHQFLVPQFIDVEDKIFGPITTRQFVILLAGGTLIFVLFKLFRFVPFVLVSLLVFGATGTLAFLRVNGQPFHFFLLNLIQTTRRPHLKVWNKELTTAELRERMREAPKKPPPPPPQKEALSSTKLQELSLVVNTGGVYRPEEPR